MIGERIHCCVPFCKRTAAAAKFPGCNEIICGKHWRMAPKAWRSRRRRMSGRYRRKFGDNPPWAYESGSRERIEAVQLRRIDNDLWEMCKKAAIEAAGGIR